ncbi:MAG TPA: fumarylacetoacetate hydrolase family protein [Paraburkholderia sp.]|jgi:2-keto-4-pentenoate hydratase|nr:fumarylacetoacetate hydrolase family protein [Paraburkholderia sp.]
MSDAIVSDKAVALAARFVDARTANGTDGALDTIAPELRPANADEAYDAQHATLRALGASIAGWKVGAKSADGPAQGAPLPASGVFRKPATLSRAGYLKPGLELEIAFTLGRRFDAHSGPYDDATVIGAIESVHAAIEVVASRFRAWPDVDKLWQLADLQNHGALVVGEGVRYDAAFPFVAPGLRFTFGGASAFDGTPANPAGDPRRLLAWVVNHSVARGVPVEAGTIVTAGTYTGLYVPSAPGVAHGEIDGLPPVQLALV